MCKFLTQINKEDWAQLVEYSTVASFFQTPVCYDFYQSLNFLKPFVFGVEENGVLQALVCGYVIADGNLMKHFLSRRAIIPGGILVAPQTSSYSVGFLMHHVKQELKKQAIYIEIRNYFDYTIYRQAIEKERFMYHQHLNFHVPTVDVESSLKQLNSTKRRDVKLSQKNGAEIVLATTLAEVQSYYLLLKQLYQEKVKTSLFPYDFFEKLFQLNEAKFFLIKYQERIIGGSVCVTVPGRVLYEWFVCGLDREIKNIYPSTLATWGAIEYAANNQFDYFDMMGAGKPTESYGVREFKSKFGGNLVEYGRYRYVCNSLLYKIGELGVKVLKHK